jgi:hypothetical protein
VLPVCYRQHRGAVLLVGCLVAAIVLVNSVVWPIVTYYRSQISTQPAAIVVNNPDAVGSDFTTAVSADPVLPIVTESPTDRPGKDYTLF